MLIDARRHGRTLFFGLAATHATRKPTGLRHVLAPRRGGAVALFGPSGAGHLIVDAGLIWAQATGPSAIVTHVLCIGLALARHRPERAILGFVYARLLRRGVCPRNAANGWRR